MNWTDHWRWTTIAGTVLGISLFMMVVMYPLLLWGGAMQYMPSRIGWPIGFGLAIAVSGYALYRLSKVDVHL